MWGICGVCTLALTVAKISSHYDRFAISVPARSLLLFDLAEQDLGSISGPKGPQGTRGNGKWGHIRGVLDMNSGRFGKRRFGKNMAADVSAKNICRNVSNFFRRNVFAETSLPKRLCRNVLFPLTSPLCNLGHTYVDHYLLGFDAHGPFSIYQLGIEK